MRGKRRRSTSVVSINKCDFNGAFYTPSSFFSRTSVIFPCQKFFPRNSYLHPKCFLSHRCAPRKQSSIFNHRSGKQASLESIILFFQQFTKHLRTKSIVFDFKQKIHNCTNSNKNLNKISRRFSNKKFIKPPRVSQVKQ